MPVSPQTQETVRWCSELLGVLGPVRVKRMFGGHGLYVDDIFIAIIAGDAFYPDPTGESELRLCFSSVMPATIDEAIKRLAACLPAMAERRQLRPIA